MAPASEPRHLLMVCTANIARSPSADLLARRMITDRPDARAAWQVASAGVQAIPGAGLDPTLGAELIARGIDQSVHRARQLDTTIMEWADLVLTFEIRHRSWILGQWPDAARRTFTIRRAAALLATPPRRADVLDYLAYDDSLRAAEEDFADPYGRGPEAARSAVAEIEQLLGVIIPALTA